MRAFRPYALRLAAGWALPVASGALVVLTLTQVRDGGIPRVDRWTRSWVADHQDPFMFTVLNVMKDVGGWTYAAPLLLGAAAVLSVVQQTLRPLVVAGLSVAALAVTTLFLQAYVARPGPTGVGPPAVDGAWPSGHAVTVVVAVLVLVALFAGRDTARWLVTAVAILVPAAVGSALVYCGHHWLTDVVVAAPLGYLIVRAASLVAGAVPVTRSPIAATDDRAPVDAKTVARGERW